MTGVLNFLPILIAHYPNQNDWRNIFKRVEYKFLESKEYLIVLIVVFLLSVVAIAEIVIIMLSEPEKSINDLMALIFAIFVILSFLIVFVVLRNATRAAQIPPTIRIAC